MMSQSSDNTQTQWVKIWVEVCARKDYKPNHYLNSFKENKCLYLVYFDGGGNGWGEEEQPHFSASEPFFYIQFLSWKKKN